MDRNGDIAERVSVWERELRVKTTAFVSRAERVVRSGCRVGVSANSHSRLFHSVSHEAVDASAIWMMAGQWKCEEDYCRVGELCTRGAYRPAGVWGGDNFVNKPPTFQIARFDRELGKEFSRSIDAVFRFHGGISVSGFILDF